MMYPQWQLKGTNLAANWRSKERQLDILPWMAPGWLFVSQHKHSVCVKVSGLARHHIHFGNDNSFLMTGGAFREERLTTLGEKANL